MIGGSSDRRQNNPEGVVWTMGVMSRRGIAPGHQDIPIPGSQNQKLSEWTAQLLRAHGLGVVRTPATHTGGSALDVHITAEPGRYQATVRTLNHKFSDHSISVVQTHMSLMESRRTHVKHATSPATVVVRTKDKTCVGTGAKTSRTNGMAPPTALLRHHSHHKLQTA